MEELCEKPFEPFRADKEVVLRQNPESATSASRRRKKRTDSCLWPWRSRGNCPELSTLALMDLILARGAVGILRQTRLEVIWMLPPTKRRRRSHWHRLARKRREGANGSTSTQSPGVMQPQLQRPSDGAAHHRPGPGGGWDPSLDMAEVGTSGILGYSLES